MPNPILVFVSPDRFDAAVVDRTSRKGVTATGLLEDIHPGTAYELIILRDDDDFAGLDFLNDNTVPVFGVEHMKRPVAEYLQELYAIAPSYQRAVYFRHLDEDPMYPRICDLIHAPDQASASRCSGDITGTVRSADLQGALVTFLMNEQIGALGGIRVDNAALPAAVQKIARRYSLEENVTKTIDFFLDPQA